MSNVFDKMERRDRKAPVELPKVTSFEEMLGKHARVKTPKGHYVPYHFEGRELLRFVAQLIDEIMGTEGREPLRDSSLAICGGAQFGKTILILNLLAYLLGVRFLSAALYLPDGDKIEDIVDGKFRPDVIDQIPWFAELMQVGKTVNKSGKTVQRKGAILCTDGERKALGYVLALNKPATSISADVVLVDERDDVQERFAKYIEGRLTASDLRLIISIGTMRKHGAGQNKQLEEGTKHIAMLDCPCCGHAQNPEDSFPGIVRKQMGAAPSVDDPQLTYEGDFKRPGDSASAAIHEPGSAYYLGCVECGAELDRSNPRPEAQYPDRARQRKWSVRLSQLAIGAVDLNQVVKRWGDALADAEAMVVFRCDVLGLPKSMAQQISPAIIERARGDHQLTLGPAPEGAVRYGGLDMGDRCWFIARQTNSPLHKEAVWLERVALGSVLQRVPALYHTLGLSALFIDSRPDAATSRNLVLLLNGLAGYEFPTVKDPADAYISFPGGLTWDGNKSKWIGLRAAVVEFVRRDGGLRQVIKVTDDGIMYPCIQANRDQTIQRVVNELLTAEEGVVEVVGGALRQEPVMRIPHFTTGAPPIIETFTDHLVVGSQKVKDANGEEHFIDKCENHLLLANGYSALAELVADQVPVAKFSYETLARGGSYDEPELPRRNRRVLL